MYLLFYVDSMKKGFAGNAKGPIIRILKSYKDDKGLLEHEKVHVKQWWCRGLLIHSLIYKFSEKYRYKCEVEAYRKQMEYSYNPELFARFISTKYKLDVKLGEVYSDLTK